MDEEVVKEQATGRIMVWGWHPFYGTDVSEKYQSQIQWPLHLEIL